MDATRAGVFPKIQISPWPLSSPAVAMQSRVDVEQTWASAPGTCTALLPQEPTDPLPQIYSDFCFCDFFIQVAWLLGPWLKLPRCDNQ